MARLYTGIIRHQYYGGSHEGHIYYQPAAIICSITVRTDHMLIGPLNEITYPAGTVLFHEGDQGDRMYVVLEGQIDVVKALGTPDERLIATADAGQCIGEMSLIGCERRRMASARAQTDVRLLVLTRADLNALLSRQPALAQELLRTLSTRLRVAQETAIRELREQNRLLAQAYADLQSAQAQLVEQEALARELQLAREIQQRMLPCELPCLPGLDIGARMVPAQSVGGDFFDVFPLGDDALGIAIGDVVGKGIPAALLMGLTCSLLRAEARHATPPQEAFRHVNQQLLERSSEGVFVTALYGVLHRVTREFVYVRAGHALPLVYDATGDELPQPLGGGHPLGLFDTPAFDVQRTIVPRGGTLVLYTDGVTEAMNERREFFGSKRLRMTVQGAAPGSAQALCDYLVHDVIAYQGATGLTDDITVVAVRA
jgi:serine phosphatase RsbU (regulator of sigma subunit)